MSHRYDGAAGCCDALPKPFDIDDLVGRVRVALADRPAPDGGLLRAGPIPDSRIARPEGAGR
jgi:DNA-binding response OmpR family regulator